MLEAELKLEFGDVRYIYFLKAEESSIASKPVAPLVTDPRGPPELCPFAKPTLNIAKTFDPFRQG